MASVLEEAATRVVQQTAPNNVFDPSTYITLIATLLQIYQQCRRNKSPGQIKQEAANPGILARIGVRRHLRQNFDSKFMQAHGEKLTAELFAVAAGADDDKYAALEKEIASEPLLHD